MIQCIVEDPRWDRQTERRAEYYAEIVGSLGIDLQPLESHLRGSDDHMLALETLGHMVERPDAVRILQEYVAYGSEFGYAITCLREHSALCSGLDRMICDRFPDDDDLRQQLESAALPSAPWSEWRDTNPRLGRILGEIAIDRPRYQPESNSNRSAAEILAGAVDDRMFRVLREFRTRVTPRDLDLLHEYAYSANDYQRALALYGIAQLADARSLPHLLDLAERGVESLSPRSCIALGRALEALPAELTLPYARLV
ncbi:MAG: hypothetical protein FJX76_20705 [Armatimonadetes bacterium]|nr:hypothetical protein [Armatimonadota bacterium]